MGMDGVPRKRGERLLAQITKVAAVDALVLWALLRAGCCSGVSERCALAGAGFPAWAMHDPAVGASVLTAHA